jgi:hypothetical protein
MFTENNREVVECRRKFGLRAVFAVSDGPVDSDDETLEYSKVGRYSMLERHFASGTASGIHALSSSVKRESKI